MKKSKKKKKKKKKFILKNQIKLMNNIYLLLLFHAQDIFVVGTTMLRNLERIKVEHVKKHGIRVRRHLRAGDDMALGERKSER